MREIDRSRTSLAASDLSHRSAVSVEHPYTLPPLLIAGDDSGQVHPYTLPPLLIAGDDSGQVRPRYRHHSTRDTDRVRTQLEPREVVPRSKIPSVSGELAAAGGHRSNSGAGRRRGTPGATPLGHCQRAPRAPVD